MAIVGSRYSRRGRPSRFCFNRRYFYGAEELPHRDMSEVPHPFVSETVELFRTSSTLMRNKIMFIHMNHTNPILFNSPEKNELIKLGFNVAEEGEIISLNKQP